jgi:hypothetical protein
LLLIDSDFNLLNEYDLIVLAKLFLEFLLKLLLLIEGIVSVFKNNVDKDLEKQVEALPEALYNFTGSRQLNDDITYIILKKLVK